MVVDLLLALVIVAVVGTNFKNGIWGNAVKLVTVITAALLATNFFEPIGAIVESFAPSAWQFGDLLGAWIVFSVVLFGLTYATMKLSFTSIRFPKLLDDVGGAVLAACTGWVIVCFLAMTLHIAPLAREPFFGFFRAEQPMFFGFHPDRIWLAFSQQSSLGVYSTGGAGFDPKGDFLLRAAAKRDQFERGAGTFVARKGSAPSGGS